MSEMFIQARADQELKEKLLRICKISQRDQSKEVRFLIEMEYQRLFPPKEQIFESSRVVVVES